MCHTCDCQSHIFCFGITGVRQYFCLFVMGKNKPHCFLFFFIIFFFYLFFKWLYKGLYLYEVIAVFTLLHAGIERSNASKIKQGEVLEIYHELLSCDGIQKKSDTKKWAGGNWEVSLWSKSCWYLSPPFSVEGIRYITESTSSSESRKISGLSHETFS